ncbi:type IV pilin protein [Saccharospirillum alexandrii]|uniref:type IV pilin protein n=1 Tax=Saccharospirillum alexandrii TaxID=2448477 RepID=UPI000FD95DA7|nr:prepilin-type N-terminal cleavage/methylation domain-containing protein [Saccharospirillum alexandrii]
MIKQSGGFTLLEIMLVVGIIGALAVIAVPLFNEYKASARDSTAHADAKNAISVMVAAQK